MREPLVGDLETERRAPSRARAVRPSAVHRTALEERGPGAQPHRWATALGQQKAGITVRVLVAVDGSPSSRQAVDLVAGIAWPSDSAIRVVNVVPIGSSLFGWIWPA